MNDIAHARDAELIDLGSVIDLTHGSKVDGAIDLQTGLFYGRNGLDQDD